MSKVGICNSQQELTLSWMRAPACKPLVSQSSPSLRLVQQLCRGLPLKQQQVMKLCVAAGKMTDTRSRLVGTRPPRLFAVSVRGERSLLALSSRPWLGYSDMGRWQFMPLSYDALDYAAVSSLAVAEFDGLVGTVIEPGCLLLGSSIIDGLWSAGCLPQCKVGLVCLRLEQVIDLQHHW